MGMGTWLVEPSLGQVFGLSTDMVTLQRYRKCVATRGLGELAAIDCGWSRQ